MCAWIAGTKTELKLCLRSAEESLVDVCVGGIESNVCAGGVGEALEDDGLTFRNVEELAELECMLV